VTRAKKLPWQLLRFCTRRNPEVIAQTPAEFLINSQRFRLVTLARKRVHEQSISGLAIGFSRGERVAHADRSGKLGSSDPCARSVRPAAYCVMGDGSLPLSIPPPKERLLFHSGRDHPPNCELIPTCARSARTVQPGGGGALEEAYQSAGFREIKIHSVDAPLRLCSAAECTRFERESFGAPHAMLANVSQADRDRAWTEIEAELRQFEGPDGFVGPCELLIGATRK